MKLLNQTDSCAIYQLSQEPATYVASTPESRAICNDPLIYGLDYTQRMSLACQRVLEHMKLPLAENETSVVHLLRGGLNFGLREALGRAYSWNHHSSTFLSAQRKRQSANPEAWEIGESEYQKFAIPPTVSFVFGDVVASGASLRYGVETLLDAVKSRGAKLRSMVFFTIGGPKTEEMFHTLLPRIKAENPDFEGVTIVYLEGRFPVAERETSLRIKVTGTDLLRHGQDLAPEFVESQYDSPMFPVERCTIYDAGSRAFEVKCYLQDVLEYWESVATFHDLCFTEYLAERCPGLSGERFQVENLSALATTQVEKLKSRLEDL